MCLAWFHVCSNDVLLCRFVPANRFALGLTVFRAVRRWTTIGGKRRSGGKRGRRPVVLPCQAWPTHTCHTDAASTGEEGRDNTPIRIDLPQRRPRRRSAPHAHRSTPTDRPSPCTSTPWNPMSMMMTRGWDHRVRRGRMRRKVRSDPWPCGNDARQPSALIGMLGFDFLIFGMGSGSFLGAHCADGSSALTGCAQRRGTTSAHDSAH